MGNCLKSAREESPRPQRNRSSGENRRSRNRRRRNEKQIQSRALKSTKPKWKSDIPITMEQLLCKRDEFWETAPAFEGRKEIWDALKAAATALENGDYDLAHAIVQGANILLPLGSLTDCYDELGNRYQLPLYVLSTPINLAEEHLCDNESLAQLNKTQSGGKEIDIPVRLSTGKELMMHINTGVSIYQLKNRIMESEGISCSKQRIFFCGHLLNDRERLKSIKIPKGFVLQVMVVDPVSMFTEQKPGSKFVGDELILEEDSGQKITEEESNVDAKFEQKFDCFIPATSTLDPYSVNAD